MNTVLLVSYILVAAAAVTARQSQNAARAIEQYHIDETSELANSVRLDAPELIRKYGYPSETHNVITEDGYILEIHRIPHGINNQTSGNRPVVFLMHGLISSSAHYLLQGPSLALPYILAEEGYDVWLGNARGNYYSRRHVTLDPDNDKDFWRFSWDEIGNFDLSATIDYVLQVTGQSKMHYIGHSQGGTTFLVLNSLRPEYNEKFISFQGLAPAALFENNESPLFKLLAPFEKILETLAFSVGLTEVGALECKKADNSAIGGLLEKLSCLDNISDMELKGDRYYGIAHYIAAHSPAGASIRQFSHYGQCIRYNAFRRYNYDAITNSRVYGSRTPPDYDLSKVTVPSFIHYGLSDVEVNYRDLYTLSQRLPRAKTIQVPYSGFDHTDFLWFPQAKTLLYKTVLDSMRSAERAL